MRAFQGKCHPFLALPPLTHQSFSYLKFGKPDPGLNSRSGGRNTVFQSCSSHLSQAPPPALETDSQIMGLRWGGGEREDVMHSKKIKCFRTVKIGSLFLQSHFLPPVWCHLEQSVQFTARRLHGTLSKQEMETSQLR